MMKKVMLGAALAGFAASSAFAAWELVDDFESYADDAAMMAVWSQDNDPDGSGGGAVLADDPLSPGNKVMQSNAGATTAETGTYNVRIWRSIPSISSGVGTIYFRFAVPDVTIDGSTLPGVVDQVFGISPVAEPTAYGDYSMLFRQEFDGSLDIYDTDGYVLKNETLPGNTWYEVWLVYDYDAKTYDFYIQGGDAYPTQTKLTDAPFGWRNATIDPLITFLLTSSAGTLLVPKGLDAALFDDLYVDTAGENLNSPSGGGGTGPSNELVNISTRGLVGQGDEVMVGGYVITGEAAGTTVLIRGIGPTLGGFGVANTVEDPVIKVFDSTGAEIAMNDDWGDDADIAAAGAAVGAFDLTAGSTDAALLLTGVAPGSYTVQLSGKGTTAQNGLLEIYKVP